MRILRLASPAISWTELNKLQSTPAKQWHNYIFISIACLLGAYFASLRIRYALKNKIKEDKYIETDSQEINIPEKQTLLGECCKNIQLIESVNSVYLFGAFKVFDSLGEDISGLFTSRVKLIFIYIILNSRNKGVLSSTLNDLFWADKPVGKARNIKGVTINQIRKIISTVEGVELTFEKGYYRINFTTCYCDYWHYLDLQNAEFSEKDMEIIFLSGRFLEGLDSIVLDKYKLQVEEFASVYIPKRIEYNYSKMEDRGVLRFCRILSQVDPLNETALIYTIISLNRLKRLQDSAIHYASFANLYKQMMGEEYYHSYTSICEQKTKIISED